jgi:hypothetical protein
MSSMPPELILIVSVVSAAVALLSMSLAKAAKAGDARDSTLGVAHSVQEHGRRDPTRSGQLRERIEQDAPWLDLGAHPRPTRGAPERAEPPHQSAAPTHPRFAEPMLSEPPAVSTSADKAWPTLSVDDTARTLGVRPDVLQAWEARYGFPKSCQWTTERGCTYSRREILALSEALDRGLSISSAIAAARSDTTRQRTTARKAHLGRHPAGGAR